jgi:hypothetical protein
MKDERIRADSFRSSTAFMGKIQDSTFNPDEWISDSGATHHICGDKSWFKTFEPFAEGKSVMQTSNAPTHAMGQRMVVLEALIKGQ